MYNSYVVKLSATDFRQKCLALIDDLPSEGILITRHGMAVAKLVPVKPPCADLIGTVPMLIDEQDDLFTTGERWDAES